MSLYEGSDDHDLIERYCAGESRAFDEIVNRYERRVFAIAARMCGQHEAHDVTQDVFINAMRALRRFRGDAQLSTWFHRVAVNASLDHLRRRKRRPETALEIVKERPSDATGPDERAIASSRAAEVQAALAHVSDEHRAVLVLADLQGLDYGEVAEALGIPVGTVKSRLHRGRVEMARRLGHLRETSAEPQERSGPLRNDR